VSLLVDPANGDYSPVSAVTQLVNNEAKMGATGSNFEQAGALIQQVVASGGGAQLGAFETGAWR